MSSPTFGDAIDVAWRYVALSASPTSRSARRRSSVPMPWWPSTTPNSRAGRPAVPDRTRLRDGRADPPTTHRHKPSADDLPARTRRPDTAVDGVEIQNVALAVESSHRNALLFPAELINQPMPAADPQTAAICIRQCEQLLNRRRSRRGIAAEVRTRIIAESARIPSMAEVAGELCHRTHAAPPAHQGRHKLSRTFDEVRATLAAELLDSGFTVEETAGRFWVTRRRPPSVVPTAAGTVIRRAGGSSK